MILSPNGQYVLPSSLSVQPTEGRGLFQINGLSLTLQILVLLAPEVPSSIPELIQHGSPHSSTKDRGEIDAQLREVLYKHIVRDSPCSEAIRIEGPHPAEI